MNVALAESLVGVPVTVTVYAPVATLATVKDPDAVPLDTVHAGLEMSPVGDEDIKQPVSLVAKFDPETNTFVPPRPEVGDKLTVGVRVAVNVAVREPGPVTVTVVGLEEEVERDKPPATLHPENE